MNADRDRAVLDALRDIVQEDVGGRGLRTDPHRNLINACPDDFAAACRSLADAPRPLLAVVTGFFIPTGVPPAAETDGPLGAVFLARALVPLGIRVVIAADAFCLKALETGINLCGLRKDVPLVVLPSPPDARDMTGSEYWQHFRDRAGAITHLLAIERVGPSHTLQSIQEQTGDALGETYLDFVHAVPDEHQDRCHTMRGRDITNLMSPAHRLFEAAPNDVSITTLGIGDGGNEIGMGKIPWEVIHRNIPNGGLVACRVPTQHLLVCGVSNWGAYALAAGVAHLRGQAAVDGRLFDSEFEREVLEAMVERGPLVDGVTGESTATVDGLPWDSYASVLPRLRAVVTA